MIILGGPSYEWLAANSADDVTDEFIRGPADYKAGQPSQQAASSIQKGSPRSRERRRAGSSKKVFVVHGHDHALKADLEVFLHNIGLEPTVLHRQVDGGQTLIERRSNAAAYNNRAVAFWEIGEYDRALADFAEAIRLAPDDASPAKHRGMMLQRMGNLPAAPAALDLAVRIAPEDPYIRRTRAHARLEEGDLAGAAEDFTRASEAEPEFARQYLDRAAVYERLGQPELAEQDRAAVSRLA